MNNACLNHSPRLSDIPSPYTSHETAALPASSYPLTASLIQSFPQSEEMLSQETTPNCHSDSLCPDTALQLSTTGTRSSSTASRTALKSASYSPPPAPRLALLKLPDTGSHLDASTAGALASMNNLLSSLSQDHIPDDEIEKHDKEVGHHPFEGPFDRCSEFLLPSSSPNKIILSTSSPPRSSPPRQFSSSPSESSSLLTDAGRRSPSHEDSGARSSPDQLILSEEFELTSPLLFAQCEDQCTTDFNQMNPLSDDFALDSNSDEANEQIYHITLPIMSSPMPSSSPGYPVSSPRANLPIELTSSPMPSSSPGIPASSPPVNLPVTTTTSSMPSSSPGFPVSSPRADLPIKTCSSPPRKRKREEEEGTRSLPGSPTKRSNRALPAPKRSTMASQQRQHKKLVTPFRSPLMSKQAPMGPPVVPLEKPFVSAASGPREPHALSAAPSDSKRKRFSVTARAAGQFKSPLSSDGTPHACSSVRVRLTPQIQTLERKIQVLKRALKVKKDNEEEVLADLTARWTEAGREVAWEVWELVKNNQDSSDGSLGEKRSFKEGWGWDVQGDEKRMKSEDSWGWSTANPEDEDAVTVLQDQDAGSKKEIEEDRTEYTLGLMLRRLGIDPATLGWNEQEGTFKDD
ncbi:hypothetical protein F5878DRAFT_7955 [Lentinula raphanica]|uniref:Uncharacterized protein n=1 Tax=Lentinula raphanica TaxID=153919 RepID=A0AA38PEN4_9AGAR|nr:hypothetical protein F5878DRAFT_7955 [Lentinula raphanica]